MSQFHPEDASGSQNIVSNQDVVLASDRDQTGAGDIVFKTGGVERARIKYDGSGSGWPNILGGSITYLPASNGTDGAFTNPATANKRFIRFEWNGAAWGETSRASADYA